jgi:hypothetical protein
MLGSRHRLYEPSCTVTVHQIRRGDEQVMRPKIVRDRSRAGEGVASQWQNTGLPLTLPCSYSALAIHPTICIGELVAIVRMVFDRNSLNITKSIADTPQECTVISLP